MPEHAAYDYEKAKREKAAARKAEEKRKAAERAARLRSQTAPDRRPAPKPKAKPLPVPGTLEQTLEQQFGLHPPKPKAKPWPYKVPLAEKPGASPRPHLPRDLTYLSPENYLSTLLGGDTPRAQRAAIERDNQRVERERRAAEKAKKERAALVRSLNARQRKFIGQDKIREFVQTGASMGDGFGLDEIGGFIRGVGQVGHAYGEAVRKDWLKPVKDVFSVADWYATQAPEALLGKHEKGKGYVGGAAEAWDKMSTQEQIDTIVGGKSLGNVLQGQGLNPANIGRAFALAAMAPIPFGKGLPSLATVLLRAGMSVEEAKVALQTGRGIREALQATKTPVLTRIGSKGVAEARLVRLPQPEDADAIESWGGQATRRGFAVLSAAKKERMPTLALHDEAGKLRAVAAYMLDGDNLIVNQLAGAGKGGGRAMMRELAQEASDLGVGMKLVTDSDDARAFYTKLGMTPKGEHGFSWTPEEAAAFARKPLPDYKAPAVRLLTSAEAEALTPQPGMWYHGTTEAAAKEIMDSGVLKVGTRSEPNGAWLSANPQHAAFHGKAVIEVPEALIPSTAERISAFGGMISSPVDIALSPAGPYKGLADDIATQIIETGLHLPPELGTHEQLSAGVAEVFRLAEDGAFGKDWYQEAARGVMLVSEELDVPPEVVAQLFAIYSQAADTIANASFVFSAIDEWKRYGDIFSGRFPVRQSQEAMKVLRGEPWEGRKRSSFYANMLRHLPGMEKEYADVIAAMAAERGAEITHPVTVDRWVVRMFRPDAQKDVPEKFYDTFETIMQRMAAKLGWEPEQVQAAAWVAKKQEGFEAEIAKAGGKVKGTLKSRLDAGAEDAFHAGIAKNLAKRREREAAGQLFDTGAMEVTPQMKRLANQVNKKWGGFTVDRNLQPVPEVGYSVTVSITETPYRLHGVKGADVAKFRDRWADMLKDKRFKIGGFSDDQNPTGDGTDTTYLSITRHFKRKADALKYAREQGQETVYEYKTGDGIRTGLTRDEQAAIIERLRDEAGDTVRSALPPKTVFSTPEAEYRAFLDDIVRASGKGKKGVTDKQRTDAEEEMLKYADRFGDDPEYADQFEEFQRLYDAVYHQAEASTEIPWGDGEFGGLNLSRFWRRPDNVRVLRSGDMEQQMQGARSAFTQALIERPADWASAKLASEESKAAALIRKVLPTAAADARVAKQAGRHQINEASRAQAVMLNHVHALPDSGSAEDLAHFYWAQMPEAERNAAGLQRVRDLQADELREITSGRAGEFIEARIGYAKGQLKETQDLAILQEVEDLKTLASDLPHRAEDLAASMAGLDKIIAKPPKLDPKIIAAVRGLAEERKDILIGAGVLDPERAAAREGLLSNWLGLEPTGEEVYMGHRLGKVRGAQPSLLPVSPGLGRARVPLGVRQQNKLVLARSGRLRASTHVAAEDWQAAQTYQSALRARDDLALMGKPFEGRLPEGYMIVNPRGRAIPPHWKTLPAFDELDDEGVQKAAKEIMDGFLADGAGKDALIDAAKEAGVDWSELRIVPERVVKRYYGQFNPARGAARAGKAYDAAVDFTAASIIFARVGYIPKNIAQNLIMAVPHQGPFMLANVPRAAQALLDPNLRHFLHAEVGFSGATHGIGEELRYGQKLRGLPGKAANLVGKIADDPMRFSAFIHEAAALGVIPRYSAHLSEVDVAALLRLFTDPTQRPVLNNIRSRSVEAMADFSRLTPTQRRWARRFLIIPGWLWAGSRYPFHFAATHPGRSIALAYVAAGEPYGDRVGLPQNRPVTDLFADNLPQFVEGINLPDSFPIFGGKTFRTTSISPVSTPYEIALALAGQAPDTAVSYANPLAKSLYNIAGRRVEYPGGSYQTGYQESIIRNLERLIPNWTFVAQTIHPSEGGRYPEDESRLGRFFRELGVVPIKIVTDDKSDDTEWAKEVERLSGEPVPPEVLRLREVNRAYTQAYSEVEKETDAEGGLTPQNRLVAIIRANVKLHPDRKAEGERREEEARNMSDDAAEAAIRAAREAMGLTRYGRILDRIAQAKQDAQTPSGMRNAGQHD